MTREDTAQTDQELMYITLCAELTMPLAGHCAEVGVYMGGSADHIYQSMMPGKMLYLFDTFAGFPELTEYDPPLWRNDKFTWEEKLPHVYAEIVERFKGKNVEIVRGDFPSSVKDKEYINESTFSFVHLDADAYLPTKNSLEYFYPRLSKGGIILIHDYFHQDTPVKKVVDEFFKDKPETVIEVPTSQAFIIKQ